ncbi:MAG: hypothetical protein J2P18_14145, partial [Nocardia sp.]|nr:hypothetical protein [Nocardia sp.]
MKALRVILLGGGALAAGYGMMLVLQVNTAELRSIAWWFGGVIVVHDGILAPVVAGVGVLGRVAPARARIPVAVGAACAAVLLVIALPVFLPRGALPNPHSANPTVLDRDYGSGLVLALLVIAVCVIA